MAKGNYFLKHFNEGGSAVIAPQATENDGLYEWYIAKSIGD